MNSLPSYAFAVLNSPEQNRTRQGVEKYEQKHTEDYEETLTDGHTDCQHEHFKGRVLSGYREETKNHHHESDHVRQIILKANVT